MNDILPIILPIFAVLVVLGVLIPVLMKTRKSAKTYTGPRDANDPVQAPGAGTPRPSARRPPFGRPVR